MNIPKSIALIILLSLPWLSYGQTADTLWLERTYTERPKIGLALSGGAAHGLAHVGVLTYLEEVGIPVDYITGTSMGAIVGGLYAIGYDADRCKAIAENIPWEEVLASRIDLKDVAPVLKSRHNKYPLFISIQNGDLVIPEGIISSTRLDLLLEELLSPAYLKNNFDKLSIPFRCFAVDIGKGEVVTLRSGKLSQAIRASMAIPSVFDPVEIDGRLLVDGGLIRNFPVTDAKDMGADIVIGSYVGSESGDTTTFNGLFDLLKQSAFMMSLSDTKVQLAATDILLRPDVKDLPVFDFNATDALMQQGYEAAKRNEAAFMALKALLDLYEPPRPKAKLVSPGFVFVNKVKINGLPRLAERIAREKIAIEDRSFTTFEKINEGIAAAHATKSFEDVSYTLNPSPDGRILEVSTDIKQSMKIGATVNHFSSTNSALLFMVESRNQLGLLSELSMQLRLSENPGFLFQYFKRTILFKDGLLMGIDGKAEQYELPFYRSAQRVKNMGLWDLRLAPYIMYEPNTTMAGKLYWKAQHQYLTNTLPFAIDIRSLGITTYSVGLSFEYTTVDRQQFPTSGTHLQILSEYTYSSSTRLGVQGELLTDKVPLPDRLLTARLSLTNHTRLHPRLVLTSMIDGRYMSSSYMLGNILIGGSDQNSPARLPFVGMVESQMHMSSFGYARLALRYNVWGRFYTALVSNVIVGNSPVTYYITDDDATNFVSRLGTGVSLGIDTPIGPIYLDIGRLVSQNTAAAYLGVGYRHIF